MPSQRLFIYDWDDTLFCTYAIKDIIPSDTLEYKDILKKIEDISIVVKQLLETSITLGDTYIITNSDQGWAELCIETYMPLVKPLLANIKIISAKDLFGKVFPNDIYKWKNYAFKILFEDYVFNYNVSVNPRLTNFRLEDTSTVDYVLNTNMLFNVLCVGDSIMEKHALSYVCACYNIKGKFIKFSQHPSIEHLHDQLTSLNKIIKNL